jgi:preprotein translocase subunit SecA
MTLTRISVRGYLLGYQRLTAMTGVAITDTDAYQSMYGLPVVTIPPFRPVIRVDNQTKLYGSEQSRAAATVRKVVARHATGQPVLVGTSSIEYSEQLSALLTEADVPHRVLNAKHHADEARIIARAAELGAVTVITKMAGRGVDIRLGGDLPEQRADVVAAGGLYVLGTNVFQTWRLEQHLRGRAGRQGDPGESDMFYCMDDPEIRALMGRYLNRVDKMMRSEDTPANSRIIEYAFRRSLRRHAERMSAGLIERTAYYVVFDEQYAAISRRRSAALHGASLRAEIVGRLTEAKLAAYDQREAEVDATIGPGAMRELERRVTMTVIDRQWRKHIRAMDDLDKTQGTDAYRRDAAKVFADTLAKIDEDIIGYVFTVKVEKR